MREETRAEEEEEEEEARRRRRLKARCRASVRVFRRGASAIGEETLNDDIVERVV